LIYGSAKNSSAQNRKKITGQGQARIGLDGLLGAFFYCVNFNLFLSAAYGEERHNVTYVTSTANRNRTARASRAAANSGAETADSRTAHSAETSDGKTGREAAGKAGNKTTRAARKTRYGKTANQAAGTAAAAGTTVSQTGDATAETDNAST